MHPAAVFLTSALLALALAPLGHAQDAAGPPRGPWRAFGRVTDGEGKPFPGVEVRAFCGSGTLRRTGVATSGADGRYELDFGPGVAFANARAIQAATISARQPGFFEKNLNRQGGCLAAWEMPREADLKVWGGDAGRLFLPGKPLELDFAMLPAARVAGRLVDEAGNPLAGYSVGLDGVDLPPSTSVVASAVADARGRFALEEIPTTYRYQFAVRKSDPKPPWDDTWAGAGLRFEPPGDGDLRAWFGTTEIRLKELVIRVAGPGMHGREAMPLVGVTGFLDLAAGAGLRREDRLVAADQGILTLRNTSRPDVSRSLLPDPVPATPQPTPARLTRTRSDPAGEFTISFENPAGLDLKPGQHQVVFQVFVGASRKPIRERIFRQLDVRPGRYEVPVRIAPEWVDDSRVSLTFLTIQPDHDAWIKSFFDRGAGTAYKGLWAGDGAPIAAIPFAP